MRNIVGEAVQGADFYDRLHVVRRIWSTLEVDNILLLAPRRVGKTSVLYRLRDEAPQQGRTAIFWSAARAHDELDFVRRLVELALEARPEASAGVSALGRLLEQVKRVGGVELGDRLKHWFSAGEELLRALHTTQARWLMLIDELPVFITRIHRGPDGVERARLFLEWLQAARQAGPERSGHVRWVMAGSIGLDTVVARMGLSATLAGLELVHLGPFETETAERFLVELCSDIHLDLDEAGRARLLAHVGWLIPHHLQLFVRVLHEGGSRAGVAEVDEAYERLCGPDYAAKFDHWDQRLVEQLGAVSGARARRLLTACARVPAGVRRDTLRRSLSSEIPDIATRDEEFAWLERVLLTDGYLVEDTGRLRFRSPLLRGYWARKSR